jgi:hypothetical protein
MIIMPSDHAIPDTDVPDDVRLALDGANAGPSSPLGSNRITRDRVRVHKSSGNVQTGDQGLQKVERCREA